MASLFRWFEWISDWWRYRFEWKITIICKTFISTNRWVNWEVCVCVLSMDNECLFFHLTMCCVVWLKRKSGAAAQWRRRFVRSSTQRKSAASCYRICAKSMKRCHRIWDELTLFESAACHTCLYKLFYNKYKIMIRIVPTMYVRWCPVHATIAHKWWDRCWRCWVTTTTERPVRQHCASAPTLIARRAAPIVAIDGHSASIA